MHPGNRRKPQNRRIHKPQNRKSEEKEEEEEEEEIKSHTRES